MDAKHPFFMEKYMYTPEISDIFTFDQGWIYSFYLHEGIVLTGSVVEAKDNGIVLNEMQHIPTSKIIYFVPFKKMD